MRNSAYWRLPIVFCCGCCLSYASTVEGRVIDDRSGVPLLSVGITVFDTSKAFAVADLESDAEGRFSVNLAPGSYRVEASKVNYLRTFLNVSVADVVEPKSVLVRLVGCAVIAGIVSDAQGRPLKNVRVYVIARESSGPSQPADAHSSTDNDGQYRLFGLAPGRYVVAAAWEAATSGADSGSQLYPDNERPQLLTIAGGEELTNINFALAPRTAHSISGRVDAADGRGPCFVSLVFAEQPMLSFRGVQTRADGFFYLDGIPSGSYDLLVSGPVVGRGLRGGILGPRPVFGRMRVNVADQDIEDLRVTATESRAATFVLRGATVSDADCHSEMELRLLASEDWRATVDADTRLSPLVPRRVTGLAPGLYDAVLSDTGVSCFQARGVKVDLTGEADSKPVEIPIAEAGSVDGTVSGASKSSSLVVVLVSPSADAIEPAIRAVSPDDSFHFQFSGLRPGSYRIAARPAFLANIPWTSGPMSEVNVQAGRAADVRVPVIATEETGP